MRRFRRILFILFLVLVVGGLVVEVGRRYWLPRHAASMVASRLQSSLGEGVHVEEVEVGVNGTSLHDVQFFETDAPPTEKPWVKVENAKADVSALDLVQGQTMPHHLTLDGTTVLLRFDKEGRLLTRLPHSKGTGGEEIPELHMEDARLTLRQEGRPDMVINGIDLDLRTEKNQLVPAGQIKDPHWGTWSLSGSIDPKDKTGSVTLKSGRLHVTQPLLNELPFISPGVWEEVQLEGDTPVEFIARIEPGNGGTHFHVGLEPDQTTVHVPSIELTAQQTKGQVAIDDGVIHLRQLSGKAARGEIKTNGDLDFVKTPNGLAFAVEVNGLDVQQLPKSWSLPPKVGGRLTGEANIELTIDKGKVRTSGNGHGEIREATLGGQPAEPIRLNLHGGEGGFRFTAMGPKPPGGPGVALALALIAIQSPSRATLQSAGPGSLPEQILEGPVRALTGLLKIPGSPGDGLLARLQDPPPGAPGSTPPVATPKAPDPRFLEINLGMKDVDLEKFVHGMDLSLPFPLAGRLSFEVKAAIPLDTSGDLKTYRAKGTATLSRLVLSGLEMEQVVAQVTYAGGVLSLEKLSGQLPTGRQPTIGPPLLGHFAGNARIQLIPQGTLSANLTLEHIPLARVLTLVAGGAQQAQGFVSGTFQATVPVAQLQNPVAWDATGNLKADRLQAYGVTLTKAVISMRAQKGIFSLAELQARLEEKPITGSGELHLTAPYHCRATLTVKGVDLDFLQHLAPEVRPPVMVEGNLEARADLEGTLIPLAVTSSGNVKAVNLKVAGVRISDGGFLWNSDGSRLDLTGVRATLYGGEVTGRAVIPLRETAPGSLDLGFDHVDAGGLSKDFPSLPFRLEGQIGGTVQGTMPVAAPGQIRAISGQLDFQADKLRVQGIPTERFHGTVNYQKGGLDYLLQGETLGGRFNLKGRLPPPATKPAVTAPENEGRLKIEGVRLGRLGRVLADTPGLHGIIDLDVPYHHEADSMPVGTGSLRISRLGWGTTELTDLLQAEVRLDRDELRFQNLAGSVGGGSLRGQVTYNLKNRDQSRFRIILEGAESAQVLAPWPALSSRIQGPLEVNVRGRLGREWSGGGQVTLVRGRIMNVEVSDCTIPLDFSYAPGSGGDVDVAESNAQVALGRMTGKAHMTWGNGTHLEGQLRFSRVDLRTMMHQSTDSSQFGSGRVTGHIDFAGTDIRSANELTAAIEASLEETQAMEFPVLRHVVPFIGPGMFSTTFQKGHLRAHLAGGILRIQELALEGNGAALAHLLVEGTVTLEERLALDIHVQTGRVTPNPTLVRLLGLSLPLAGPIPFGYLVEASNLLSNSLIHLRVSGTIHNPSIQVEPVRMLTEGAVRFFLNQAIVPSSF